MIIRENSHCTKAVTLSHSRVTFRITYDMVQLQYHHNFTGYFVLTYINCADFTALTGSQIMSQED